jgi:hypothetical protein
VAEDQYGILVTRELVMVEEGAERCVERRSRMTRNAISERFPSLNLA